MSYLSAKGQTPSNSEYAYPVPVKGGGRNGSDKLIFQVFPEGTYVFTVSATVTPPASTSNHVCVLDVDFTNSAEVQLLQIAYSGFVGLNPSISGVFRSDGIKYVRVQLSSSYTGAGSGNNWSSAPTTFYAIRIV
jgi:hypothetical protein